MSKSKKQPVYDLVFLKPLEGFVVDEVVEKKGNVESGINIKTVQYLMGHSEIATTLNIYTHVNAEQVKSEMKKLENIM